ncbi:hypothetical protein PG997_000320 [Apiospora hydei]|uniref:Heterokaryon incompatibility domain-containing protein n=1 Tax=Apiospora hydei TaxID=1337664 RepID=A0ABR1XAA2_9PEZI
MFIRLVETDTTRLTAFIPYSPSETPYAILSHTWEEGEVTFQEMMAINGDSKHPFAQKAGFKKIFKTCEKAKAHSIKHVWVDTCCIDKTSSAELSESINSMYRWYQTADVCFVYLSDFHGSLADDPGTLESCRWFTRGWCLQELIAPAKVQFFDAEWKSIGDKISLATRLSNITHINQDVLVDSALVDAVPVARRMAWASERKTTREEDMAYCLLGLFGINMPMLYGEGSNAFLRLQEQIVMKTNDLSIFAFERDSTAGLDLDLFARAPGDFRSCHDLTSTAHEAQYNAAFNLTNRGLYFRRLELYVNPVQGLSSIRLKCNASKFDCTRMHLQKVGSGLYARYNRNVDVGEGSNYFLRAEEDAYIVIQVTPAVRQQLERHEEHAIQARSHTHDLFRALQVLQRLPSTTRWDYARMAFLTMGGRGSSLDSGSFSPASSEVLTRTRLIRSRLRPITLT